MSPDLISLARRKAALARHHGADDPRTRAAASELRVARAAELLAGEPLTPAELMALLASLRVTLPA